jgi:hypothetical protein
MLPHLPYTTTILRLHPPRRIDLRHYHNNILHLVTACLQIPRSTLVTLTLRSPASLADVIIGRIHFKASPFFNIVQPLTAVVECKGLPYSSVRMEPQADKKHSAREHSGSRRCCSHIDSRSFYTITERRIA